MRSIILDLGNGEEGEIFGKDLVFTDASSELLAEIAKDIKTSKDVGLPAQEVFCKKIREKGFQILTQSTLEDIETYLVSADSY